MTVTPGWDDFYDNQPGKVVKTVRLSRIGNSFKNTLYPIRHSDGRQHQNADARQRVRFQGWRKFIW
jgi:hypothetical protein